MAQKTCDGEQFLTPQAAFGIDGFALAKGLGLEKLRVALGAPVADGIIELVEMPGKEMICILDQDQPRIARRSGRNFFDGLPGTMFVPRAVDNQFRLVATLEISKL